MVGGTNGGKRIGIGQRDWENWGMVVEQCSARREPRRRAEGGGGWVGSPGVGLARK